MDPERLTPEGSPGISTRPLLNLAEGFRQMYRRLQQAGEGVEPSPGDRIARLGSRPGPLADATREVLSGMESVLRWLKQALEALDPWLTQFDVLLALSGVMTATLEGGKDALQGMVSLGAYFAGTTEKPDALFGKLDQTLPDIHQGFLQGESALTIVPPPEDVALALAALAPLLADTPPQGERSVPSLRRALALPSPLRSP